jgi:hypothetical protein
MIIVKDQFNFWIEGAPAIPGTDEGDDKQWSNRASSAILIGPPPLPDPKGKAALKQREVRQQDDIAAILVEQRGAEHFS